MRTYVVQTVDNNGNHKLYIHQAENVLQAVQKAGYDDAYVKYSGDYIGNKDFQLNKAEAVMDKILVILDGDDPIISMIQRVRQEIRDFKMGLNEPNDEDG